MSVGARTHWLVLLLGAAACILLLVACGGGNAKQSPALRVGKEDGLASAMLLSGLELPPDPAPRTNQIERIEAVLKQCRGSTSAGQTGSASGPFFYGSVDIFEEQTAVFETADQAKASVDGLQTVADCVTTQLKKGGVGDPNVTVTDALYAPLPFSNLGTETKAYRITYSTKAKGNSAAPAKSYLDLVDVLSGRARLSFVATSTASASGNGTPAPDATAELQALAARAQAKAQAQQMR